MLPRYMRLIERIGTVERALGITLILYMPKGPQSVEAVKAIARKALPRL